MWRVVLVVAAVGCYRPVTLASGDAGNPGTDVGLVTDASDCVGGAPGFVTVCGFGSATSRVITSDIHTDTDCDQIDADSSPALCIVTGRTVTVTANVRVTGPRPLVIAARDTLVIEMGVTLIVGSDGIATGPAANTAPCSPVGTAANSGGGGGGAFQGGGGDGQSGNGGAIAGEVGGLPIAMPRSLVGGCSGGAAPQVGGDGGGAVYLVAGMAINIEGVVDAGGAGGIGGQLGTGGSGGGSGGMIVVHAPSITLAGSLRANGGSGGGGSSAAAPGMPGAHDDSVFAVDGGTAGDGTAGAGFTSSGRLDTAHASLAGGGAVSGSVAASGGGGGGGGAGYIIAFSSTPIIANSIQVFPDVAVIK